MDEVSPEISEIVSVGDDRFDPKAYERVANAANLIRVDLMKSDYEIKPQAWSMTVSEESFTPTFSGEPSTPSFIDQHGLLVGSYKWQAAFKKGNTKPLKLNCFYYLAWDGLDGSDSDHYTLYFRKLARFVSYPYFRATLAHMTASSGLTFPPLPSLNERMD